MPDFSRANILGTPTPSTYGTTNENTFTAPVRILKSRYEKITYPQEMNIPDRCGVTWEMQTTNNKTFDKAYSTGWNWDEVQVSDDGKYISKNFKSSSDAAWLVNQAIAAGFPASKVTNDISVFEGEAFQVTDSVNPKASSSKKKSYPTKFFSEGWETVAAEAATRKASWTDNTNQAQLQKSVEVPKVVQVSTEVLTAANEALVAILNDPKNGGILKQDQIIAKLNEYAKDKTWKPNFRQEVTLALWHGKEGGLQTVLATNPALEYNGDTVTFKS